MIEQRRLARMDKHQPDDRLVDFHRKAVAALLDRRDGERVRGMALQRVEKWDSEQLCNPRYVKAHKKGLMQQLFPSAESQNDLNHG